MIAVAGIAAIPETLGMELAVQIAVREKLADSAELTDILASHIDGTRPAVYDNVPQMDDTGDDSVFPYVVIGDDTFQDWSTDTASGASATIAIHSWSRYDGKAEIKRIQKAVYDALHRQELDVSGWEFIGCDFDNSETVLDPDAETRHGVQEFRVLIDEAGYGE